MIMPVHRIARAAAIAALLATVACSAAPAADKDGGSGRGAGAGGAGGRGPGGMGGRGAGITLSLSDVASARRVMMEEATPVTGNLRPLETVEVRARLEGDLAAVYAREGQPVRAGEVLARFEDSQQASGLRSAQAAVASARVDLSAAQWNLTQTRELYRQGAVAEQVLKSAEQGEAAAQAKLAAALAQLRAAAQLETDTRVVSPMSGIVEKREAENGEHLSRGTLIFTVVRNDVLELTAAVPARQANGIVPGQMVRFSVDGQPREGKVARVSPTIDPLSRSITVYVQITNPGGAIKGGTFATGRVVRRVLADALVVPSAAVRQRPNTGAPYVYKIAADRIAEADVTLGAADDAQQLVEVLAGIDEGDRVVVGNVGMLGKGMRVQVLGAESGRVGRGAPGRGGPVGDAVTAQRAPVREQPAASGAAPTGGMRRGAGERAATPGGPPRTPPGPSPSSAYER